jgi:predicted alpha/beta superfamily hydrolase
MTKFLLAAIICWFTLTPASARASDFDKLQGLNSPRYHQLDSKVLGRPLHIFVRLPEGYEENAEARYPVVYLLDGGITFPVLAGYYRYLRFGEEVPDTILVGISYGADNFEDGNLRGSDFTAPAPSAEHYGGAQNFQRMFEDELLPLIEHDYRTDPARRIVFGQSLGGQFVLYIAMIRPDLFWGHIASNPALHRNLEFFQNFDFQNVPPTQSKLFVSSGSDDDARFRVPALQWFAHWSGAQEKPWALKTVTLEGETHFSAAPASFRQGMAWLFADTEGQAKEAN